MTLAHFVKDNPLWCYKCHRLTDHGTPILGQRNDGWLGGPPFWTITATCACGYRDKHGWVVAESLLK